MQVLRWKSEKWRRGKLSGGGESSDVQSLSFEKRSDSAFQPWLADQSPSPKYSS